MAQLGGACRVLELAVFLTVCQIVAEQHLFLSRKMTDLFPVVTFTHAVLLQRRCVYSNKRRMSGLYWTLCNPPQTPVFCAVSWYATS